MEEMMTEEVKSQGGPEPSISVEELGQAMEGTIRKVLAEGIANLREPEPDPNLDMGRTRRDATHDARDASNPLMEMIAPHLAPILQRMGMSAAGAEDAAIFYGSHPEAIEYRGDLEKVTKAMHGQNIPLSREAIWDWYKGKNEDKFTEIRAKRAKEAEVEALRRSGVGEGAPNMTPELTSIIASGKKAHDLTDEELDLVLKGKGGASPVSF